MTEQRKLRVFLCHASQDKSIVRELYKRLLAEGWIDPWLDEEKLLPGQEWNLEIERAVESADVILVCLSKQSVSKDGYVQRELRFVLDCADYKPEGTLFLIPVRLEDCDPPRRLRPWQYADYFPVKNRDASYAKLLSSMKIRSNSLGIKTPKVDSENVTLPVYEIASTIATEKSNTSEHKDPLTVVGKLISVTGTGAYLELPSGKKGFLPASQSGLEAGEDMNDFFRPGDEITVMVVLMDRAGNWFLSRKAVLAGWTTEIAWQNYDAEILLGTIDVGDIYTGTVQRTTFNEVFVEVLPGCIGMLPISQLDTDIVHRVDDIVAIGDEVTCMVIVKSTDKDLILSRKAVLEGWTVDTAIKDYELLRGVTLEEINQRIEDRLPKCPLCKKAVTSFPVYTCSVCNAKYHKECYDKMTSKHCTLCGSRKFTAPFPFLLR